MRVFKTEGERAKPQKRALTQKDLKKEFRGASSRGVANGKPSIWFILSDRSIRRTEEVPDRAGFLERGRRPSRMAFPGVVRKKREEKRGRCCRQRRSRKGRQTKKKKSGNSHLFCNGRKGKERPGVRKGSLCRKF